MEKVWYYMKKDKSKILGIGCIIFAVFMIVISGIQYLNKEKKSEEKRYDSEFYEQTADYNFDDADNSIGESETTTVTETAEEELDDNVEPLVYEDFEIQDLTEEEIASEKIMILWLQQFRKQCMHVDFMIIHMRYRSMIWRSMMRPVQSH